MTFMPLLEDLEHRILVKIANGRERNQIINELKITEASLRNHISNILATLGAENTHHAVSIGFCTGLLIEQNIEGFNVRPVTA